MPSPYAPTAEEAEPGARERAAPAAARRGWFRGAPVGALLFALLFAGELVAGMRLSMMGVHDDELQKTIFGRFGTLLLRKQAEILAAYLAVGLGLGLAAAIVLSLWDRARDRRPSPARRWLEVAGIVLAVHAWRLAVTVVRYPQLYVDELYAHGGFRRALETTLTDRVPQPLLLWAGWAAVALFAVGPMATRRGRRRIADGSRRALGTLRRRRTRLLMAGGAALLLLGAASLFVHRSMPLAAAAAAPSEPREPLPNILFLAVDSLRADRVGPGHEAVAPHLAALAARGVRFEQAHVTIPRTFPSWATLLSGRFPAHHGLRNMFPPAATRAAVGPLLPSLLRERGFHTAVVSDFSGEIFSRLDAGFDERRVPYFDMKVVLAQAGWNLHPALMPFVASSLGHRVFPALAAAPENADPDRLADAVIDTIDALSRRGPFFLTAFFSTPHFPYAAPDPYYRRFTRPGYAGPFRYDKPVAALGQKDGALSDEDVAQIRGLYDGAVASVDDAIGRVLSALSARGLDERTIVVLFADHGESLFEPGRGMGHGEHLRGDQMLHIPLVVVDPVHRFPPHAVPGIVRDVDLAPTVLALVGAHLEGGDGVDLSPLLRGERGTLDLPAFAETELWLSESGPGFSPDERLPYPPLPQLVTLAPDDDIILNPALLDVTTVAKHRAIRTARWKLLYVPTRDGVRLSLYDVVADPDERTDVAMQHPEVVATLREQLYRWMTLDGSTVEAGFVVPRR